MKTYSSLQPNNEFQKPIVESRESTSATGSVITTVS